MPTSVAQFIEHFGVLLAADGYPRVAGRLFGLLLLAPEVRSLDALAKQLGVSKASVSINIRLLEHKGVVERVSQPGDRRDYYRIVDDILARTMEHRVNRIRLFKDAVHTARNTLPVGPGVVRERLKRIESAYEQMLELMVTALEMWREHPRPPGGAEPVRPYQIFITIATLATAASAQEQPRALSLGDAVRLAASQSGAALSARARGDEATARTHLAHSALLPRVGAAWSDGQRSFNTASFGIPFPGFDPNGSIIGPVRTIDIRAHAQADLFDPGARSDYRNAEAAAARTDADAAVSVEGAMAAAAGAYVRLAHAEALVTARSADSALARELLGIAEDELRAGVGVSLDVSRAQTQIANLRAQLITARNERDRARLELLRAVGLPLTTAVTLRDSLPASESADAADAVPAADAAVAEALKSRSDVRAAAAAVTASSRAVQSVRSERLPTVGVFGDEGATSAKYGYLRNTYNYGLQVSVPIFEGSRDKAREEERTAVLRGAEQRQRDLETQIGLEVRSALLSMASAREQLAATREGLRFADLAVSQARDRFRAGVAGSGDVVSAQVDLSTARRQNVDALASVTAARVSLALAQGRLATLQ